MRKHLAPTSQRHGNGLDNFAQDGFGSLRFLLQRGVTRAGHDAMRKNGDSELLKVVGQAKVASIEERASLCGALQHEGAARAHPESELLRLARAIDNFKGIVVQAGVHFNVVDSL